MIGAALLAITTTTVDRVELNTVVSPDGTATFTQVVFWDLHRDGSYHVVAWRMVGKIPKAAVEPLTSPIRWRDGDTYRQVYFSVGTVTRTEHDPEILDRAWLPQHLRRGL